MKKNVLIVVGGLFILMLASLQAMAQEAKSMGNKMNTILADAKHLRATEVTLLPGEKTDMHTHPAHFFYALSEGKLIVHYQDGKDETFDLRPGVNGASDPERPHVTENVGTTTVKFLIVELKEHPYKEKRQTKIKRTPL